MHDPIQILACGETAPDLSTSAWGPYVVHACTTLEEAAQALGQTAFDAVLMRFQTLHGVDALLQWTALPQAVLDAALVVAAPEPPAALALKLLQRGAQDVLPVRDAQGEALARAIRLAVERKRLDQAARKAYATDLATGLPSHSQLLEHMTHLLALREREPAPMALIALRIEGLAAIEHALGQESANVLRRKVAVRIRAGLRASDVVASLGVDAFAVLLAWIDAPTDAPRVAGKIASALTQPLAVAGTECSVSVRIGLALYPDHGREADALLRRAAAQANEVASVGRRELARRYEHGGGRGAANDDEGSPPFGG